MSRLLLASALVVAAAVPVFAAPPTSAADYFSEKEKDFGVTAVGPALVHYFAITNSSKQAVEMGTPRIQCGCVSVTLLKGTLEPGETTYLVATMNTTKIPVHQINTFKSVAVTVPFSKPNLEEVTVLVKCFARNDMSWNADAVAFGSVTKGKAATASLKVTLFNQPKWEITEVKSNGAFVKAEAKLASRTETATTYDINCTLDTKCPAGNWMSELVVSTNATGIEKMRVPVTVNVVEFIAPKPGTVEFGTLPMGGAKSMDVTLSGKQAFKIVEVKGGDAVVTATPKTTGSLKEHTLKLDVKADTAGDLARQIIIVTDSKEQPEVIVPVSGAVKK